jgi:hypothetical protein
VSVLTHVWHWALVMLFLVLGLFVLVLILGSLLVDWLNDR